MSKGLYTSQVHLKRLLAGQAAPAFTPAPDAVLKMLDPAFFPGMGALNEDEHGRIQCPARGCGKYWPDVTKHLRFNHPAIGGANGLRAALSIARRVSLLSEAQRERYRAASAESGKKARAIHGGFRKGHAPAVPHSSVPTIGARNWANTCPGQVQAKVAALATKIGRSPTGADFETEYGVGREQVDSVFGSWNGVKAQCGLIEHKGRARVEKNFAAELLRCWFDVHGDLPSTHEIERVDRAPMIPTYPTLLRAFGVSSWRAAMKSAAEHLGIKSERYGFDFRKAAA